MIILCIEFLFEKQQHTKRVTTALTAAAAASTKSGNIKCMPLYTVVWRFVHCRA